MTAQPTITEREYLARERESTERREYLAGRTFAMAGGSPRHNLIAANIIGALRALLRDRPCVVLTSDQRVHIEATGLFTYPDVTVVCGAARTHPSDKQTLLNPTLIVEVLSPSTEAYDRGAKFAHYRRIPSLREYLLVAQSEVAVDHYLREDDGSWKLTSWSDDRSLAVPLPSLDVKLPLEEAYLKADLVAAEAEVRHPETPS